jgi:sulfide:quinone oxidoreductase
MARVIVLGGGFGGVVAAERLARTLGPEHQITLVSRRPDFIFYPALVRLAFGHCRPEDVFYDLRLAMLDRRVEFIEAEVARPLPDEQQVLTLRGQVEGKLPYDYLVFALGRRLGTEQVWGFFEHAHHLLSVPAALEFGAAVRDFSGGHAVIGYCPDARLAVPAYETAFALDRRLRERGERDRAHITVVSPDAYSGLVGGEQAASALRAALEKHEIEFVPDFPVTRVTADEVLTADGRRMEHDLLMLVPPFQGPTEAMYLGLTDADNYVRVDNHMKVAGAERMYAAGDAVNFLGPKMGHMAVLQGEVAASNVAAEIEGRPPQARYEHELMLVVDEGGPESVYVHQKLWEASPPEVRQGRFWGWAKHWHERYWTRLHALNRVEIADER